MNNPNPLLPQGSLQSQSKGKSNFRIAVFTILAIHVVLICGFLIQGCKREPVQPEPVVTEQTNQTSDSFDAYSGTDTNTGTFADPSSFPTYGSDPTNGGIPTGTQVTTGAVPTGGVLSATPVTPTNPTTPSSPIGEVVAPLDPTVATATGETTTHVVAKGDMLSTIARDYKVSVKSIQEANPDVNPTRLQIGQKLTIPAASGPAAAATTTSADGLAGTTGTTTTYTVKSGDVLERIAKNHKTTVSAIKSANGLKTDRINVGQKLKIPAAQ